MNKIFFLSLFLVSLNVGANNFDSVECKYVKELKKNATPTDMRDALIRCQELTQQTANLLELESKILSFRTELDNTKKGVIGVKSNKERGDSEKLSASKLANSEQVFLLASSGRGDKKLSQVFYKGSSYWLREGESFPGGTLKETGENTVTVLDEKGKTIKLYLSSLSEIKTKLGISEETGAKANPRVIPIGQ